MITRSVNDVEYDIDETKANELYFESEFIEKCSSSGIADILDSVYQEKNKYVPLSLFIELTGKCNFNCPFCYIHNCEKVNSTNFIEYNKIKSDLAFLIDRGLMTCTISGGECFLYPDFIKLYTYLKKSGVLVTVLSNLSLLNEEIMNVFIKYPPYKVDVTIYSLNNEDMELITGQKHYSFDTVLNNILILKSHGINVTCKTPCNVLTESQIPEIEKWCKENDIPYFYSLETFDTYDGSSMEKYKLPDVDVFRDKINAKKSKIYKNRELFGIKRNFECKGGQYGLFISYDYHLRPCMPFYLVPEANFDIKLYGINESLRKMLLFINEYKGKYLKGCSGCNYMQYCDQCVISHLTKSNTEIKKICSVFKKYF